MNISKSIKLTLTTILFLVFSNNSFSQKFEPKERPLEPDHTITSEIMGIDYQLYISFPESYSTKDSISYPVLYVLDASHHYELFNSINKRLRSSGKIEDVIIVGIGSGLDSKNWLVNRHHDYTVSVDTIRERKMDKRYGVQEGTVRSGGASKFLSCIKTEIIPFVDKHYKTNTDRGILGHSLGGLFTAYCLLNSDGYFTRFGISSPSLFWKKKEFLDQAVLQFTINETWDIPPTKVFISVGEKEGEFMIPKMVRFSTYLERNDYENIDLSWHIFENETHGSVIPVMMSKSLSTLYAKE